MNAAFSYDVPNTAICAMPMLNDALRLIESRLTGKPLAEEMETTMLESASVEELIAFCIRRANDVQNVVQTAFDALTQTTAPEAHPVAMLLDEIL